MIDGPHVIETYRRAALASPEGVEVFARAYKGLFESSGEDPRAICFDQDLIHALEEYLRGTDRNEANTVRWILESIKAD